MAGIPSEAFGSAVTLERYLKQVGIAKELRGRILARAPRSREEMLLDPAIQELVRRRPALRDQLIRVLRPPATEPIPPAIDRITSAASRIHAATRLVLTALRDEERLRLVILDGGGEIASVNLTDGAIDHSTLRIFGFRAWDMPNVSRSERRRLAARLFGPLRRQLYALARDKELDGENAQGFRALAAVVTYTGSVAGGPPLVDNPGRLPEGPSTGLSPEHDCANGCGPEVETLNELIPDGSWTPCCTEHDLCYCKGECDTCGRLRCDNAFFDCMLRRTNLPQAYVYYLFVRAFGGFGAYECDEPFGIGGIAAVAGGIIIGIVVGYLTGSWQAGVAAAVVAIALLSFVLCNVCEPLHRWREQVQELIERLVSWRRFVERLRRCARRRGWLRRLSCRAVAILGYIIRLALVLLLIPILVTIWVLEKLACGA